jgi:Na+/phosphate symporter
MNRMTQTILEEPPSKLMGTLAIMTFAAACNLRDVANALGKRDLAALSRVPEKNAKQSRLRAEIEEQVVEEMSRPMIDTYERRKLVIVSQVALMIERMGARTVDMAKLCDEVLREARPSRVTGVKKLIEHAVFITDRAATGLVGEDVAMAKIAVVQKRVAMETKEQVHRELTVLLEGGGDAAVRADLLLQIVCKAQGIIEEAGQLAHDVISFLEKPEV